MNYLLDTCALIWFFEGNRRLSANLVDRLTDPAHEVGYSHVSALELVIKRGLGKLPGMPAPSRWLGPLARKHGLNECPVGMESILHLERLPPLHRDPFDRLLVAQAIVGNLTLVTPDPLIRQYQVKTLWNGGSAG